MKNLYKKVWGKHDLASKRRLARHLLSRWEGDKTFPELLFAQEDHMVFFFRQLSVNQATIRLDMDIDESRSRE